jgi:hypothetical protein
MIIALAGQVPPEAVEIMKVFFSTIAVIVLGLPIIRAFIRRWERPAQLPPQASSPDTTQRLERIEQAVEAVAIEVERIAEAQRFSAKLMAEQAPRNLPRSPSGQ